jgi:hypothetical protein
MLPTAPSSIEHQAARRFSDNRKKYRFEGLSPPMALSLAIIWLTIKHQTEKGIGLEGLSPPMALSLAIIWLTISANRNLNQASSKQFVMSTQAYAIFEMRSPSGNTISPFGIIEFS